jgi:hypothetical protein
LQNKKKKKKKIITKKVKQEKKPIKVAKAQIFKQKNK